MWANFFEYLQDKWNWLECISLSLLAGGLFIRIDDSDVYQGRALFALSAPLVFSRVLFYGQVLQRQGVVIQVRTGKKSAAPLLLLQLHYLRLCPSRRYQPKCISQNGDV